LLDRAFRRADSFDAAIYATIDVDITNLDDVIKGIIDKQ